MTEQDIFLLLAFFDENSSQRKSKEFNPAPTRIACKIHILWGDSLWTTGKKYVHIQGRIFCTALQHRRKRSQFCRCLLHFSPCVRLRWREGKNRRHQLRFMTKAPSLLFSLFLKRSHARTHFCFWDPPRYFSSKVSFFPSVFSIRPHCLSLSLFSLPCRERMKRKRQQIYGVNSLPNTLGFFLVRHKSLNLQRSFLVSSQSNKQRRSKYFVERI